VSPSREWLSETALSLSLSLSLSEQQCICPRIPRPRLGNSGGILFNIYIYIYMSNGDRPSASLVKGRAREKERGREARDIRDEGHQKHIDARNDYHCCWSRTSNPRRISRIMPIDRKNGRYAVYRNASGCLIAVSISRKFR